jgi:RHS repeat-associated protein
VDGPNDLIFLYDAAERLYAVKTSQGQSLKSFSYWQANGTNNWSNGKLKDATRYNYPVLGTTPHTAVINERYNYGGLGGRVSKRDTSLTFDNAAAESFTQSFGWTELGDPATLDYPQCTNAGCVSVAASPRTVVDGYGNGALTSVASGGTTWGSITYHPNGMVNQVTHSNGVVDTQAMDPAAIRRPASLGSTLNGATLWTTGTYSYDGAGNITKMGTSWFTYDPVSRLTTGTVFDGPTGGGTQKQQGYSFDAFGNLTSISGTSGRTVPVDPSTNRLNATGVLYDPAGNLTLWNGNSYEYDAFDQMKHMVAGSEEWLYVYTAGDERIWSFKVGANNSRWTLRDLGGKVLREYLNNQGNWSVGEDYFYRSGFLLASVTAAGAKHFHLDHLGTPRLVTNASGVQTAYHVYYPFGEEATAFNQDTERMKLTGHERDLASLAGAGDDLDYMHARFCSPLTGRFLSVDRVGAPLGRPQAWNRYAYAQGNPVKYFDPSGRIVVVAANAQSTVKSAYARSETFRHEFDQANKNPDILVMLSVSTGSGMASQESRGETNWAGRKPMGAVVHPDGTRTYRGVIYSVIRGIGPGRVGAKSPEQVEAREGHEIHHANELAKFGSINDAPDVRTGGVTPGMAETQSALDTENAILTELNSSKEGSLSAEEEARALTPSSEWDKLGDAQRQQCLSDLACLTLLSGTPIPPP